MLCTSRTLAGARPPTTSSPPQHWKSARPTGIGPIRSACKGTAETLFSICRQPAGAGGGGTTTLAADVTSVGPLRINDGVVLAGDVTLATTGTGAPLTITGQVNGTNSGAESLTLTTAGTNSRVFLYDSVGTVTVIEALTIQALSTAELNGEIRADYVIDLTNANVRMGSDVALVSFIDDVRLGRIDGGTFTLAADAAERLLITGAIGPYEPPASVIGVADRVDAYADVTAHGLLALTARGSQALRDVNVTGNLVGQTVVLNAQGSAMIGILGAQDNTAGSTQMNGPVSLFADISAHGDLLRNGNTVLAADVALTSTNGSVTLNGPLEDDGGPTRRNLTLNAPLGDVALHQVGRPIDGASAQMGALTVVCGRTL